MASIDRRALVKNLTQLVEAHWPMLLIVILAAILRTWRIEELGILFGDAGRDLLAARQNWLAGKLPLVGIASSVPRFHQGPLTIWVLMGIYSLVGHQTWVFQAVFALIGLLAVIFIYEFCLVYLNKKTGVIAALLLTISPMAVAHSRVPYHITPIPLATLGFLFGLNYLWQKKKWGVFVATLSWIVLFQFELAAFGLVLLIPYVLWQRKIKIDRQIVAQVSAAGLLGFLPQIIHDLTHPFAESQLGGFVAWVGYRLVSLVGVTGEHGFSLNRFLNQTLSNYWHYWHRMFGVENWLVSLGLLTLLSWSSYQLYKSWAKVKPGMKLVAISALVLTVSYLAYGSSSEAYFPPYLVFLPLIMAWGLVRLIKGYRQAVILGLSLLVLINVVSLFRNNFLVSNQIEYNYRASTGEMREIIAHLHLIGDAYWQLDTTLPGGKHAAFFDNFRWLSQEMGLAENRAHGRVFYLEEKDSALSGYPGLTKVEFTSYDLYYH